MVAKAIRLSLRKPQTRVERARRSLNANSGIAN